MSELIQISTLDEAKKAVDEVKAKQAELEKNATEAKATLTEDFKKFDKLVAEIAKQKKELSKLRKTLYGFSILGENVQTLKDQLGPVHSSLKSLHQQNTPETGSIFVRLFLGEVNVKQYRDGERFRLKQEYEKFKRKTNPQFLMFVALAYFFPQSHLLLIIWQIWLLYYYITLALRENILRVNGSAIRPWWIIHHYLSMSGSLTWLLWPKMSPSFVQTLNLFLAFSSAQGLVQILINRYQQGQLYKLVAMGKANMMDVAGESEGWINDPGWTPSAAVLFPFLVSVQSTQLYISYRMFKIWLVYPEWQVLSLGIIFFALGTGNLITTLRTYYHKWKSYQKRKNL